METTEWVGVKHMNNQKNIPKTNVKPDPELNPVLDQVPIQIRFKPNPWEME
jgi:hypothetical protein